MDLGPRKCATCRLFVGDLPDYVEVDPKAMSATFTRIPELADVPYPVKMEPAQVVEFYSS